jgi:pimeloyl-ACP methyl ester carboxylesterase
MDFVADVDGVVSECVDGPVTLVGHSMGAVVASLFASARPERVRSLFLVEPPVLPDELPSAAARVKLNLDGLAAPQRRTVFPDMASAIEALRRPQFGSALGAADAERAAARLLEASPDGIYMRSDPRLQLRTFLLEGVGKAYLELFRDLRMPIAVVLGARSTFYAEGASAMLDAVLPRPTVFDGGHNLHWDVPGALADAIARADTT